MEKKQAEFLVHQFVPVEAILGIAVYNETAKERAVQYIASAGLDIPVKIKANFYF